MLTVQYKGKGERTIGTQGVYPGELLSATPNLLAAWKAEHGDVFVVVGGAAPQPDDTRGVVIQDGASGADQASAAEATDAAPKGKRK